MKPVQVTDALENYMHSLLPERDGLLARMEREAEQEGVPIIGPHEGMLLYLLVRLSGAKRILELGTATGYSGIWLLRGTGGKGQLTTFETESGRARRARENFSAAGLASNVAVIEKDALVGIGERSEQYDACFIDLLNSFGSEEVTERAFRLCLDRLSSGGLLIADNALRQGEVVQPGSQQARDVARYNQLVAGSSKLESVIVPLRDGISVARVK